MNYGNVLCEIPTTVCQNEVAKLWNWSSQYRNSMAEDVFVLQKVSMFAKMLEGRREKKTLSFPGGILKYSSAVF